ncbi:MAG: M64 family metallo-endopeptidase [Candidatus Krumholzibacteria bacterium]|nr:M64 family metallo-endopeptidase [Candidatus Krumholzibacteria bacterium]
MRRLRLFVLTVVVGSQVIAAESRAAGPDFDRFFTAKALRIDLYHTGDAKEETYSLDEARVEPYWAGNPRNLLDTLNLGSCILRVFDVGTNMMIYSRGYSTLFDEWKTTEEAIAGFPRTFHESLMIPLPKAPVQVRIDTRDRRNVYKTVYDLVVDPADYHVSTERRFADVRVRQLFDGGPSSNKVDVVVLGDGYDQNEMHKLRGDAERLLGALFDTEPFKSRKRDFNVRLIETASSESGVDEPREGKYRNSMFGLSFNTFDISRYMLTFSTKVLQDIVGNVPCDAVILIANTKRYGGGGIYNLYSAGCSNNEFDAYVFIHEFAHAFAGLGDEYYSSQVAYNDLYPKGMEPWEPNITALLDTAKVKWGDLIPEGTPVPTPDDSSHAGAVGAFEGAGYSAKGLYRPCRDCIMFSKRTVPFCPVCRRAIERMIDCYTK